MIKGIENLLLFSENPDELASFYKDKVGLAITFEGIMGEGEEEKGFYMFEFKGGSSISIMHHSQVLGKAKEPQRIMFNLEVENIEKESNNLKEKGIKVIQDIYHVEDYGRIATFEDLDGNYFQLVQIKESN